MTVRRWPAIPGAFGRFGRRSWRPGTLVVVAGLASVYGGAVLAVAPPREDPPVDVSTDAGPGSIGVKGPAGATVGKPVVLSGRIASVSAPASTTSWGAVTVEGSTPEGSTPAELGTFKLLFEPWRLLPLGVGEVVQATITCRSYGPGALVCDTRVVDERGRERLVIAGSGGTEEARGWSVGPAIVDPSDGSCAGKPSSCSIRHISGLVMGYAGKHAFTRPGRWRKFTAGGTTWLVFGQILHWEGVRPLYARDYRRYAIVRMF